MVANGDLRFKCCEFPGSPVSETGDMALPEDCSAPSRHRRQTCPWRLDFFRWRWGILSIKVTSTTSWWFMFISCACCCCYSQMLQSTIISPSPHCPCRNKLLRDVETWRIPHVSWENPLSHVSPSTHPLSNVSNWFNGRQSRARWRRPWPRAATNQWRRRSGPKRSRP